MEKCTFATFIVSFPIYEKLLLYDRFNHIWAMRTLPRYMLSVHQVRHHKTTPDIILGSLYAIQNEQSRDNHDIFSY